MGKLKKLFAEFKAFITKGNVVDLAVAVVIGTAFTAIVTSVTNDIIMPLVNWALGDEDFSGIVTVLKPVYDSEGVLDTANSIIINWGNFINVLLDFIIIALVLFLIVKVVSGMKNKGEKLKERNKKAAAKLAKKLEKNGVSKEEAETQAAAQVEEAQSAPAEEAKPTTEELLMQIRDLLAEKAEKDSVEASQTEETK